MEENTGGYQNRCPTEVALHGCIYSHPDCSGTQDGIKEVMQQLVWLHRLRIKIKKIDKSKLC